MTFNDAICCRVRSPMPFLTGAIRASNLLDILGKHPDSTLEVSVKKSKIVLIGSDGARRETGIAREEEVTSPYKSVEPPKEWNKLDENFFEAVSVAASCAGKDATRFTLTCVHITKDFVEACDTSQIARYPVKMDIEKDFLVRAEDISRVTGFGMLEYSVTDGWIHFRDSGDMIISVRKWLEDYPVLDDFVKDAGDDATFTMPGGLDELVSRLEIFAKDNAEDDSIMVTLRKDYVELEGSGAYGYHKEGMTTVYNGEPVKFLIPPKLLCSLSAKSADCSVSANKLSVKSLKFSYATCTTPMEDSEELTEA